MVLHIRPTGIDVGDRSIQVRFAKIDAKQIADTPVVAAVTGKSIVVLHALAIAENEVTVRFRSATTPLTGPMTLASRGGFSDDSAVALFATAAGAALNINLDAAVQVSGYITYFLI